MSRFVCPSCEAEIQAGLRFCVGCGLPTSKMPLLPRCSKCHAIAAADDKFCTLCRGPILAPSTPQAAGPFCTECGHNLGEGDRFCLGCGKPLAGKQAPAAPPDSRAAVPQLATAAAAPAPVKPPPLANAPITPIAQIAKPARPLAEKPRLPFTTSSVTTPPVTAPAKPTAVAPPKPPVIVSPLASVPPAMQKPIEIAPPKAPVPEHAKTPPKEAPRVKRANAPAPAATAIATPHAPPKHGRALVAVAAAAITVILIGLIAWSLSGDEPDGPVAGTDATQTADISNSSDPNSIRKPTPPPPQLTSQVRKDILASPALNVEIDPVDPAVKAFEPTGNMELLTSSAAADGWQEFHVKCEIIRRNLNRESKEYPVMRVRVGPSGATASVQPIGVKDDQWDLLLK